MKFCKDCKYVGGDGLYLAYYCRRGIRKELDHVNLVTGVSHEVTSGRRLDCEVERHMTVKIPDYPDDRCGEEGKYFERR